MNVEPVNFSSPNPNDRPEAASTEMSPAVIPMYPSNSSEAPPQDKIQSDTESAAPSLNQIQFDQIQPTALVEALLRDYGAELPALTPQVRAVVTRIAIEVERVCSKSSRIQTSGDIAGEKMYLAGLRMQRCLNYYRLRLASGSGRVAQPPQHGCLSAYCPAARAVGLRRTLYRH